MRAARVTAPTSLFQQQINEPQRTSWQSFAATWMNWKSRRLKERYRSKSKCHLIADYGLFHREFSCKSWWSGVNRLEGEAGRKPQQLVHFGKELDQERHLQNRQWQITEQSTFVPTVECWSLSRVVQKRKWMHIKNDYRKNSIINTIKLQKHSKNRSKKPTTMRDKHRRQWLYAFVITLNAKKSQPWSAWAFMCVCLSVRVCAHHCQSKHCSWRIIARMIIYFINNFILLRFSFHRKIPSKEKPHHKRNE